MTEQQQDFVSHSEFKQFGDSVNNRFDDMGRNMNTGFHKLESAITRMQDSRTTQWGPIVSGVMLLLVLIGVYVTPIKSQAESIEQRVWSVETSYVPEAMIKEDMGIMGDAVTANRNMMVQHMVEAAESRGRHDERLKELEIETSRVLNDLYRHYWGDVYENRVKAIESNRFDASDGENLEDRVKRLESSP